MAISLPYKGQEESERTARISSTKMALRTDAAHAPDRKLIHCGQGMPAHQHTRGRRLGLHHRTPSTCPAAPCCPACLQILTAIHLDFTLRVRTTLTLTLSSPLSLWFSPGCYPFPHSHITFILWFLWTKDPGPTPIHLLSSCLVLCYTNCLWAIGILKM